MNPNKVYSLFLQGNNLDSTLFKTAIHYAECGLHTWFVSPEPLEQLPSIENPNKEILNLITFVYFKDFKDLMTHLNGLHMWHKVPNVIIVRGFEFYIKLFDENYNPSIAALLSATLLDTASVCVKKTNKEALILIAVPPLLEIYTKRLQVLHDMYVLNIFQEKSGNDSLEHITNFYNQVKKTTT